MVGVIYVIKGNISWKKAFSICVISLGVVFAINPFLQSVYMIYILEYAPQTVDMYKCSMNPDGSGRPASAARPANKMSLESMLNGEGPSTATPAAQPGIGQQQTISNEVTSQVDSGQASSPLVSLVNGPYETWNSAGGVIPSHLSQTVNSGSPSVAEVDLANRGIFFAGSMPEWKILEIAEELRPILLAHRMPASLTDRSYFRLSAVQLGVLKLFMSEGINISLSEARADSYGGLIKQGYYNRDSNDLPFCGATKRNSVFYKTYNDRVLAYRRSAYNVAIFNRGTN